MTNQPRAELLQHTAAVISAHLGHNRVEADGVPGLIQAVYQALSALGETVLADTAPAVPPPAVPVRRSIRPDYLVCLEDGAKLTMLKRYLKVRYGLTPEAYRERWGLPASYPMVAPNYASRRAALAKQAGLGRRRAAGPGTQVEEPQVEDGIVVTKLRARRARGSKG